MLKSSRIFVQRSWPATGALLALSLLSCDSGSEAAENSADTETCTVSTNDDGSQVLECPGQEPVTFAESPTCSTVQEDDSVTVSCPDQDPVSFSTGSTSCEVDREHDGTTVISCEGQDPVTVPPDSGACEIEQEQDGSVTVACPGQDPVTVPPDSGACEIEQEQDGSVTVACPGQDPVTVPADSGNCTVEEESSGAATISCPGQAEVTVDSCTVVTTPSPNFELGHYATQQVQCSDGTSLASEKTLRPRLSVYVADYCTCVLQESGDVRCWGYNAWGQLGLGHIQTVGDDELPSSVPDVEVGGTVVQLAMGGGHRCALLESGQVRCWGMGGVGQLGYGDQEGIGDDELPASVGYVNVGGRVVQLAAGAFHTCALLEFGSVLCWGEGSWGRLGYGNVERIGDDETPGSVGAVAVGEPVVQLVAGLDFTCALSESGSVHCWGRSLHGQLGYGNAETIGDDELPSSAGAVEVGGPVRQIAAGWHHICALLETGAVRCWGQGQFGALGNGNSEDVGDDELPTAGVEVDVGGPVRAVVAGSRHTCALLEAGSVRCWGDESDGRLGYPGVSGVGTTISPATAGDVELGGTAVDLATSDSSTCALLDTGGVRCWGVNSYGQLGYGHTNTIGDDETPASAGDVPYL